PISHALPSARGFRNAPLSSLPATVVYETKPLSWYWRRLPVVQIYCPELGAAAARSTYATNSMETGPDVNGVWQTGGSGGSVPSDARARFHSVRAVRTRHYRDW